MFKNTTIFIESWKKYCFFSAWLLSVLGVGALWWPRRLPLSAGRRWSFGSGCSPSRWGSSCRTTPGSAAPAWRFLPPARAPCSGRRPAGRWGSAWSPSRCRTRRTAPPRRYPRRAHPKAQSRSANRWRRTTSGWARCCGRSWRGGACSRIVRKSARRSFCLQESSEVEVPRLSERMDFIGTCVEGEGAAVEASSQVSQGVETISNGCQGACHPTGCQGMWAAAHAAVIKSAWKMRIRWECRTSSSLKPSHKQQNRTKTGPDPWTTCIMIMEVLCPEAASLSKIPQFL